VGDQAEREESHLIDELQAEIEQLKEETSIRDSTINHFFSVLNEIESNLAIVREREGIITKDAFRSPELQSDVRERINNDIKLINDLMVKNRQSLRNLSNLLEQSNLKIEEFTRRLELTHQLLEERDSVIMDLKKRLAQLDFSIQVLNATIDTLSWERERLQHELDRQTEQLNTCWYAYGTRKELIENQIILRTGGFLGIGRTYQLMDNFNERYFTRIDMTQTNRIPLYSNKATILTPHPTDSYTLTENEQGIIQELFITDEQQFWSTSRYLVILTN